MTDTTIMPLPVDPGETGQDVLDRAAATAPKGVTNGVDAISDTQLLDLAARLRADREDWQTASAAGTRKRGKAAKAPSEEGTT